MYIKNTYHSYVLLRAKFKPNENTRSSQDRSVNFNLKPPPVACSGSQEVLHFHQLCKRRKAKAFATTRVF